MSTTNSKDSEQKDTTRTFKYDNIKDSYSKMQKTTEVIAAILDNINKDFDTYVDEASGSAVSGKLATLLKFEWRNTSSSFPSFINNFAKWSKVVANSSGEYGEFEKRISQNLTTNNSSMFDLYEKDAFSETSNFYKTPPADNANPALVDGPVDENGQPYYRYTEAKEGEKVEYFAPDGNSLGYNEPYIDGEMAIPTTDEGFLSINIQSDDGTNLVALYDAQKNHIYTIIQLEDGKLGFQDEIGNDLGNVSLIPSENGELVNVYGERYSLSTSKEN